MDIASQQPLRSTPISEVLIGQMEPQFVARVIRYLESLGCKVNQLSEGYQILLPEGTIEEIYAGQSTQWTYRTTLRLSNGVTLNKYILRSFHPTQPLSTTMLAFPHEVLYGPEPAG